MAFWDQEEDLITVKKNSLDNIDVKFVSLKDKSYYDIRISKPDKHGVYHPTSQGIAIPVDQWEAIKNAIEDRTKIL